MILYHRKLFVLCVLLVLYSLGNTTWSQAQTTYTLENCLEMAMKNNPSLKAMASQVAVAGAQEKEAKSNYYFTLSAQGHAVYNSDFMVAEFPSPAGVNRIAFGDHENYDLALNLQQPLFTGFRINRQHDMARLGLASEQQKEKHQRSMLTYMVTVSYYRLQMMMWFKKITQTSKHQILEHLEDVTNLYQEGMTPKYEMIRVEYRLAEAEQNIVQAANAFHLARTELNNHMGVEQDTNYTIAVDSAFFPQVYALEDLVKSGLQARGDLHALKYREQQAGQRVDLQKSDRYPHVYAFGNFHYGKPGINPIVNEWMDYWSAGVSLQWKLWDWGNRDSKIEQAKLQQNSLQHSLAKLHQDIEKDIIDAYVKVSESADLVRLVNKELEQTIALFQYVQDNFREGMISNTHFIDRQMELTRARLKKAQTIARYHIAVANLGRAVGR
jgi:outer membrane protein